MSMLFSRLPQVACAAALLLILAPAKGQGVQATQMMQPAPTDPSDPQPAGTPVRVIPADAPMAKLKLARPSAAEPMQAELDGKAVGVAPGLRIFSTDTMLMNPVTVAGKKLPVRYKLDLYGQLLTAWVLTDAEVKAWKAAH